ncbi:zinc finger protein 454 [Drosophila nasuta]|uniref:zinc finger protein 454 n=1 Tax=Drosophila nasuta TaxID=42062 RepID=UPI00295F0F83|nr:zinc finger protein 454 [Drosophila nasuta]
MSGRCPRCNCEATGQNRLVTDSCGHSKCRQCLLNDVADCLECNEATNNTIEVPQDTEIPAVESQLSHDESPASHITVTEQGYHCSVCNKSFRSRTQQYYHRACGNEALKQFACTLCDRRFATRSHLKYHQNSHENNEQHSCPVCHKNFKQQLVLQRHMRVHKTETFTCPQCQKQFRSQSALVTHSQVHSGQSLPYKCEVCGKHYLTKANLKQHRLKHDQNSTRYACSICSKSFLRQTTLRLHQARHSQRPRHSCPQCYKTFNDLDALARHKKQHAITHRYRCIDCDVTVNRRDNMIRHMRAMHPGVPFDAGVEIISNESLNQEVEPPVAAAEEATHTPNIQRYNSVIMSVGNVQPVDVAAWLPPEPEPEPEPEMQQQQFVQQQQQFIQQPPTVQDEVQKENVKLYRKIILDLDNEEYSNELSTVMDLEHEIAPEHVHQVSMQQPPLHQRLHWRKNYKNFYENEHTD